MIAQAEQLLQRGSSVSSSLLPAIFKIFSQWKLTGAQQMTLLGLSNEKTLYNWKINGCLRPTTIRCSTVLPPWIGFLLVRWWIWPWSGTSSTRSEVAGDRYRRSAN